MSTPQSYPIVGIAYVGKNNKPIYVHSFEDSQESDLDVNLTVHSCLDILDERADPSSPSYLGFLALVGRHSTFAMTGSSRIKVFCVLDSDYEPTPRDEDMNKLLSSLHQAYVDWLSNPFVEISLTDGDPVPDDNRAQVFVKTIEKICVSNKFPK